MGGLASSRAFAADAAAAMQDERFLRREGELEGEVPIRSLDGLGVWRGSRRFGAPSIDPDVEAIMIRTGFAQTSPADFFRIVKPALAEIAHGKMGQVELRDGPLGREGFHRRARQATAEKGELIAEGPTVLRRELACVVPPFGAEGLMRSVVARKGIAIALCGDAEFRREICREARHDQQQAACQQQEGSKMTPQFVHA